MKLADAAGVKLATGYQARYVPGHIRMRELISSGAVGRVVTARTMYGMRRESAPHSWRGNKDLARWGVLADIGTHHLDLLRMLLGEVTAANGFTAAQRGYETEDLAVASLRFEGDVLATLAATASYYRPTTVVEVIGTDAALVATNTSPTGQGQVQMYLTDGTAQDITGETPHSAQAQLATVTAAFLGEDVAYATGRRRCAEPRRARTDRAGLRVHNFRVSPQINRHRKNSYVSRPQSPLVHGGGHQFRQPRRPRCVQRRQLVIE